MSADEDALLAALAGGGDGTLVDQLDDALNVAWKLASGLNLTLPTSGGSPGPYRPGGTSWDLAYDQTTARWGAAPKARTFTEKAALLEALVKGIDTHRGGTTPPGTGWKALPVLTSAAATSEHSSFQSAVPTWNANGMTVALPAKGDMPGTPNPTSGSSTQRCEILLAGWENLTGTLFLRFDFTLTQGFPIATGDWQTVAQLKNSGTGSPPLEVMVGKGGRTYLQWHNAGGSETGTEYLGSASTNAKHSVVLKVPFTTSSTAPVSGWYDGAAAFTDVSHGPTMYPGQGSYGKAGLYRSNAIGVAATITHHGVAKGATFAAVTQ